LKRLSPTNKFGTRIAGLDRFEPLP
jgi:hypothetical protein